MNSEGKKVLFIVNKFAGTGYRPELEGKILDACHQQDVECSIQYTQYRGHATELAKEATQNGFDQVIAVGGDGTVNEVAKGLIHSPVKMGIIPRGSGNGLARHLGIPVSVSGALKSLAESRPVDMDTFIMNEQLSLNVSGIGFDGHIANLFSQTTIRGLFGYIKLVVKEFIQFKNLNVILVADGKTYTRDAFILAIGNSSQYGNNARITPTASVCDQMLNITLVKKIPFYRLDFVYDLFTGKIRNSFYCETLTAKNISVSLQTPMAYHVDGEPSGRSDQFSIKLLPASLKVLTPAIKV